MTEEKVNQNGESGVLLKRVESDSLEGVSIASKDLKVDVKDLINLGNFEKARTVKPPREQKPGYAKFMPYCQVLCVVTIILAVTLLILGYKTYKLDEGKAERLKYAGFAMAIIGVSSFIAVIYINSVSENNLIDSMRSFRRSKAANPQIAKKLKKKASQDAHCRA